jgi:hypothetical protein
MGKLNGDSGMLALQESRLEQLNSALTRVKQSNSMLFARLVAVQKQRDRQFKSLWFRIGLRLGFYY